MATSLPHALSRLPTFFHFVFVPWRHVLTKGSREGQVVLIWKMSPYFVVRLGVDACSSKLRTAVNAPVKTWAWGGTKNGRKTSVLAPLCSESNMNPPRGFGTFTISSCSKMNKHMQLWCLAAGGGTAERCKLQWPFAPGTRGKIQLARQWKQVKYGVSQMFFVFLKKNKLWSWCPES